ncbi:MAG TPA: CoA transferase [Steroidobacteraceae bacterium]|nr:CoA transferase [Steroidobacteraceae bacterium]
MKPIEFTHGALSDLRVVELGTLLAGPFCGQLLGDMGAEVIKVEAPKLGDPMRHWGRLDQDGASLWWPVISRNKKSITLDLRRREGQELLKELAANSDFLLENFRPGTMEKWGLDYEALSAVNPRLIMIRVSGYGQTGPYAHRAGFGAIGEAMGGLRYVVGDPSTPPSRMGISIGDSLAATFACVGALSALHYREKTGRGQIIDAAIYESVLNMMESLITEYDKTGYVRERTGAILPNIAPSNVYPTRDGLVVIGANQDTVFRRLAEAMGRPELAQHPDYADHLARGRSQLKLDQLIGSWTATLSTRDLLDLTDRHGVPAGLIYRAPDMLGDPQFAAREAIVTIQHPTMGTLKMQNVAPKLSRSPGTIRSVAPALGQDNDEVYRDLLHLAPQRYAELKRDGII